jgi:hypothetical protein
MRRARTAGAEPVGAGSVGAGSVGAGSVGAALAVAGLLVAGLLAGCGAPPQPLPTSPPRVNGSGNPSGTAYPGGIVPTGLPTPTLGGLPTTVPGLPAGGYTPPVVPTTKPSPTPSPTPTVPPAPVCRNGPTAAQVLTVLAGAPGVPVGAELTVTAGPFCAGTWQFATVERKPDGANDKFEPLLVVTRGKPSALTLVEAGSDVCSDVVQKDAPPGIRVRACGT